MVPYLSPSVGLCLVSDGHAGQIPGPVVEVDHRFRRIGFAKLPEAQWLRCQAPSPQEGSAEFVNTLLGGAATMVDMTREVLATTA